MTSLRDRFARLCEIASPTGSERDVADAVRAELEAIGLDVTEDDAADAAHAGAGNLIARLPGSGAGWVSFFAHLDTVPHDQPIEVELVDGVFRSAGETILGADNKAAVAVLIELAARAAQSGAPSAGLELIFTVAEEDGLRGAKELDVSTLRAPFGYVLDHASPIGEVITQAPTHMRVTAHFEGVEAHAGIRPEDGHSAIEAAAAAVAAMELGRVDAGTTTNAGVIHGGTAPNVVAGACRLDCEARSLDDDMAVSASQMLVDSCTRAASEGQCDVDVDVAQMFRGYRVGSGDRALGIARDALAKCGHAPREVVTGGGSDANALISQGYPCLLLANGTEANHTPQESVAAARLEEMWQVCEAIVDHVGAQG
ncbi:MAG: M20/M25/M40 family metallo-hydrolase [Actinomycetota bacterium]|nr:M20/M25/M40 family metallo-hydrolase [Actinomycetota bacterium]